MLHSRLDHIVISAPSLAAGVQYVRDTLAVSPQVGGEHVRMGTHNYLLKLGAEIYLEVIAINADAPRPDRPRWYQLDEPDRNRAPHLVTWAVRTDDIHSAVAASPVSLGDVEAMSRGQIHWLISIPKDGSLPLQGIGPTLIQWPSGTHPTNTLPDSGCVLTGLEGFHPQAEKVLGLLQSIGFAGDFHVSSLPLGEQPYLVAHIQTPAGPRQLGGPNSLLNTAARRVG